MINFHLTESWGGDDDWEFKFEPEVRKQKAHEQNEENHEQQDSGLRNRRNDPLTSPPYYNSSLGDSFTSRASHMSDSRASSPRASHSGPQLLQVSQVGQQNGNVIVTTTSSW